MAELGAASSCIASAPDAHPGGRTNVDPSPELSCPSLIRASLVRPAISPPPSSIEQSWLEFYKVLCVATTIARLPAPSAPDRRRRVSRISHESHDNTCRSFSLSRHQTLYFTFYIDCCLSWYFMHPVSHLSVQTFTPWSPVYGSISGFLFVVSSKPNYLTDLNLNERVF